MTDIENSFATVHDPDDLPVDGEFDDELPANGARTSTRLRCEAGQPCPQTGYWHTPAQVNSRRHVAAGNVMPSLGGDFGATIWQWDENQQA